MENHTKILREYPNINFHYTKGKTDIFYNKQFHPHYELYLLLGGSAEFINDHVRKNINPNDLVIIPPGEYHRFLVDEAQISNYERCVLDIYPDFLGNEILEEAFRGKEFMTLAPNDRIVENIIYLKNTMSKSGETDFGYILSAIATDIVFLIKQRDTSGEPDVQRFSHPISSEIMNYVNSNYQSNPSLKHIAEHFYMSVSSVSHIFKRDFGISLKRYLTEKRMNAIHTDLQNGKKPQETAEKFGFSNYATFYRSYCGYFGVPPSHTAKKKESRGA